MWIIINSLSVPSNSHISINLHHILLSISLITSQIQFISSLSFSHHLSHTSLFNFFLFPFLFPYAIKILSRDHHIPVLWCILNLFIFFRTSVNQNTLSFFGPRLHSIVDFFFFVFYIVYVGHELRDELFCVSTFFISSIFLIKSSRSAKSVLAEGHQI